MYSTGVQMISKTRIESLLPTLILLAFLHITYYFTFDRGHHDAVTTTFFTVDGSSDPKGTSFRDTPGHAPLSRHQGRELDIGPTSHRLKWAIFTPPKPFEGNPHQANAFQSWMNLRIPPKIFICQAGDFEPNHPEFTRLQNKWNMSVIHCKTNADGLLLQSSIFEEASKAADVDIVVVINSDIILGDEFLDALELAEGYFDRFLMVGARFDNLKLGDVPETGDEDFDVWLQDYRSRSLKNGALHTYGGSDYFAWRPSGDPSLAAIGGRIPPFTYGRGKADNWIVKMAIQNGVVHVIDASTAGLAIHPAHNYNLSGANDRETDLITAKGNERRYTNYWSTLATGDLDVNFNKHLAYTFGSFLNGQGTPLDAPWQLTRCVDVEAPHSLGFSDKPCLRYRQRPGSCPCEHNPYVSDTLTEVEFTEKFSICSHSPSKRSETFDETFVLQAMLRQQAENNTIILLGFNHGYQNMLLNMICRLQALGVSNYIIAAFDPEAYSFCRWQVLPCFPVSPDVASRSSNSRPGETGKEYEFGSDSFRELTKIKSRQTLRVLELGYNVLWSDIDILWKLNALERVLSEVESHVDIAVQSNAPPMETADNGHRRINSGFYYVKQSPATVDAFREIVEHAKSTTLSEQPSFYSVLCGDGLEHVTGNQHCVNRYLGVNTCFLDRNVFPNGAMSEVMDGVTADSEDDIAILHFNWRVGRESKENSFAEANAWFLNNDLQCQA